MTRLQAENVTLAYSNNVAVVEELSLAIADGGVTSIIGPNGCGKSTLLRALARLMTPRGGTVILDGEAIHSQPTKEVAKRLCLMPQQPDAPESITVEDLTRRGRYPHQSMLQPPTRKDQIAIERALTLTNMVELRDRSVDELSGGQRQRAWISMALAQDTPLLLLDEPTTYLDIAHQQEVLELVEKLNQEDERTIVLVLHDINNAAQVSDRVVAMRAGKIIGEGSARAVLTPERLEEVFGVPCDTVLDPDSHRLISIPRSRIDTARKLPANPIGPPLTAEKLSSGYGKQRIVTEVDLAVPKGQITAIVGPNACGKSTLLRTFARLLAPMDGVAYLDEQPVQVGPHRDLAKRLTVLAQGAVSPAGVLVEDLVAVGRYPYQRWWRQWSDADQQVVDEAIDATGIDNLRWRPIETLSGGQRQRVWLALALAQETGTLLLDEPTTFLDIAHQIEVLDLVWELNRSEGRTVVMVLHDLGQASRYADFIVAMKDGRVVAAGTPEEVITERLVADVFSVRSKIGRDPQTGSPLVLPTRNQPVAVPAG